MSVKKCVERFDKVFDGAVLEILRAFDENECKNCPHYKICRKIVRDEWKEDVGFQHTMRDLFAENEQQT